MFQLFDFETIVAGMLTQMTGLTKDITDFTEGGVARSLLESSAIEINRQNLMIYQGVREGIETGTYKNFSFNRLPASHTSGNVQFSRSILVGEATVPIGTRVKVPGSSSRIYVTRAIGTMSEGVGFVEVPVVCETVGAAGNTAKFTIVEVMGSLPFDTGAVTNQIPFLNGVEQESDEDRRDRFRRYIAGLSKGTVVALDAAARSVYLTDVDGKVIERVTGVLVREPFRDSPEGLVGLVEIYIDNGAGSSSDLLLEAVYQILVGTKAGPGVITPGWIAAGIDLEIYRVTAQPLDVLCTVSILVGFDVPTVVTQVKEALTVYIQGLQVYQTAILSELVAVAMYVDGVTDVTFQSPTGNVTTVFDRRIVPGTVIVQV